MGVRPDLRGGGARTASRRAGVRMLGPVKPARLSFFNEQDAGALALLAGDAATRARLRALGATVTVGLKDLSEVRAAAVRRLSDEGVPVDAWLLLPRDEGYFATFDNLAAVERRVDEVLRWRERHRLPLGALGFDFEPDLRELDALFASPARTLASWARRSRQHARRDAALARYGALRERVRAAGLRVESYQFPLLLEDRAVGSTFFQRFAGALDVGVEREVLMAYSSLLGPWGVGLLAGWAPQARAIAVGSTGGGVDPLPKLSWDELSRDLRLAAGACADVSVFSLEGCVARGFLERLLELDWSAPVELRPGQRLGATATRWVARRLARLLR